MKNTVKIITAVILAAILCFGSVTAIAAENHGDLKWNYYDYGSGMYYYYNYEYAGELKEGENSIVVSAYDSYRTYYVFDAGKSGYYTVDTWLDCKVPTAYVDGIAYGSAESEYTGKTIFHLSAGENIIGCTGYYFYEDEGEMTVPFNIEYLGEAITDITYAENSFTGLIEGYNFYYTQDEEEKITVAEAKDLCIKFSETEMEFDYIRVEIETDSETGETFITYLDYKEPVQLGICKATDIVKSMEITNLEECTTAYNYYTESFEPEAVPAGVKVTFTDGSSKTYENTYGDEYFSFEVDAPNGKSYYAYVCYDYGEEDKIYVTAYFADEEYVRHEIKTEDADICDNLGELNDNNDFRVAGAFNDIVYRLRRALSPENGLPVGDRLEYLSGIFGACTNAVFQIFCNFVEFLEYYF
ncbi:MAG: hypothetical protein IJD78_05775 [Clostridia bacterium]|nr:hypothetical protein [Clostridia bacterium]